MTLQGIVSNFPDADLTPPNVKDGVDIFGVEGTYTGGWWAIFWWSYFYNYSLISPTILIETFWVSNRPANSWEAGDFLCEYNNRVYYFYSQNNWNYGNGKIIWYIPQDGNSVTQIHTYWTSLVNTDDRTHQTKFDSVSWKIYYSIINDPSWYDYFYKVYEIDLNTEVVTNLWNSWEWQHTQYNNYWAALWWTDIAWTLTLDTSRWQTFEIQINLINLNVDGVNMSIWWINISTT